MSTDDLRAPIRVAVAENCPECGTTERWYEPDTNQLGCRICPFTELAPAEGEQCEQHRWQPGTGVNGVPAQCIWCLHITWTDAQEASR